MKTQGNSKRFADAVVFVVKSLGEQENCHGRTSPQGGGGDETGRNE
jgi:hypothetical protein